MIEALLIDWEGTIVDSSHAVLGAYREVTQQVLGEQHPATSDDEIIALNTPPRDVLALWAAGSKTLDDMVAQVDSVYATWASDGVSPRPGAAELLSRLPLAGLRSVVVSTKSPHMIGVDRVMAGLVHNGYAVEHHLDAWGMGREPKDLSQVCALHAVSPRSAAFLCDDPRDIIEAHAAGMAAMVILSGEARDRLLLAEKPDHVLSALHQVFEVLVRV